MKLFGFNYTKISAEKHPEVKKYTKVNQSLNFTQIEKEDLELIKETDLIKVSFQHSITYEPNFAKIDLEGAVVLKLDSEGAKEAIKEWKKNKKLVPTLRVSLYKIILNRCALKSLHLEESLAIPPHMNLVNVENN